jgi:serine/threonine protein kinase/tetratricopeptide (TPR) repeat protein
MTASQPDNEAIFHAARDIPDPDHRREYVREACGGDETRIAHVEALLAAADAPDSLLDRPGGSDPVATTDQPTPENPGALIGPYKLLQEIGEGGMGTVWMAQQTQPVKRLVALKVIKAGMDSRQVIARFEAERQALALMDHPNIAKVLDGGTTEAGRPYFVMDLVKGVPITRYCDEHHLTPRQRLELFVPVCQAVQHAHQKGIIHRDLKPSNVLVCLYDGRPVPKVIDFGVAKAAGPKLTDKTLFTELGQVVGTLEYMSPEQAELNQLDIDTRSDIYSLGVLLYELLTGTTPLERKRFQKAAFLEVLRLIREEESPRPSTRLSTTEGLPSIAANRGLEPKKLSGLVRGELDWIVMKALEKDRGRRYETANGFAQDIQHYLADEPVQACPPSAAYRLRKFARRNKGPMLTAVVVAAALLVGTAVSVWQAVRATNALENERRTRAALDQERTQINGKIGDTLLEVGSLAEKARTAGRAGGKQWADLQDGVRRAETLAGSELADPALVERVRGLLEQVRQDAKNRRMTSRLEEIRFDSLGVNPGTPAPPDFGSAFAAAFGEYGLPVTALPAVETARRVRDSGVRDDLLAGLDAWSLWDVRTGGTAWKGLLAVAQAADDHPWRRECRDAVLRGDRPSLVRLARREDSPRQPAAAVLLLAGVLAVPPGRAPTDEEVSVAAGLLEKAAVWHPGNAQFGYALAAWMGLKSRVVDTAAVARESIERLKKEGASPEVLAAAYFHLAQFLGRTPDVAGAVAAGRQAVRLVPGRADYWTLLITRIGNADEKMAECSAWIQSGPPSPLPYRERGEVYYRRGQGPEAIADFIKATELGPEDLLAWKLRGMCHLGMGHHDQAIAAFTKAIEAAQRAGHNPANDFHWRAVAYIWLKQWDKAIADATQAIDLDPKAGHSWACRGDAYRYGKGDMQKAMADYDVAIMNPTALSREWNPIVRAEQSERRGRWDRAINDWTEAMKTPSIKWRASEALFILLITCPDRALRDPRRALTIAKERKWGTGTPWSSGRQADYWRLLGIAHFQLGEWKEASAALTKVVDDMPDVGCYLVIAQWHLGNHDEAQKCYDRAGQWVENNATKDKELLERWTEAKELLTTRKKKQ